MRPEFTPEQNELRHAVREFCEREVTIERLHAWEKGQDASEVALLDAVARLGWLGLGVPSSSGGSGALLVDVACLLSECARGLLPRSLLGAVRGATVLAQIAPGARALASLATGDNRLALASDELEVRRPELYATAVRRDGAVERVYGTKAYVPDAVESDLHLVAARAPEGLAFVLVEAGGEGVSTTALRTFGGDRQAHVRYEGAPVVERVARGAGVAERFDRTQRALALAEMVGGMDAVVDMAVAYVKEREQFGQKIAMFQAVRHQVADIGTSRTAARHLAWRAITRIGAESLQGDEVESAVAYVGRAFREACVTAHHLHGGAGFVVEHPLHFHSERAMSLSIRYADVAAALGAIAVSLLDGRAS